MVGAPKACIRPWLVGQLSAHSKGEDLSGQPHTGQGIVESEFAPSETVLPGGISEDTALRILVRVAEMSSRSSSLESLIDGALSIFRETFPQAERMTLLLVEDGQLMPKAVQPEGHSYVSFSLAERARRDKVAFIWTQPPATHAGETLPTSLFDTVSAIYAPMVCNAEVIGVIHLDCRHSVRSFASRDLELLSTIANVLGPAIKVRSGGDLRTASVFISYCREDARFVARLAHDLRRRFVRVWYDERLQVGQEWRKTIAQAIRTTDAFVLVVSARSLESDNVKWENTVASTASKPILQIYLDSELPDDPVLHSVKAEGEDGYVRVLNALQDRIAGLRQRERS
jgi:hypothetical protein